MLVDPNCRPLVWEWRVPPGTASRPIPRFLYRLSAPLRWYRSTIAHILADECCRLPVHIRCMRRVLSPGGGVPIPSDPRQIPFSIAFELACSDGIQRLFQETGEGSLWDRWTYAQGFLAGARYVASTPSSATCSAECLPTEKSKQY